MILINLSVVEIITIVFMMVYLVLDHVPFHPNEIKQMNRALCAVYHCFTNLFYSTMTLIPFDRLLCVRSPTFYYSRVRVSPLKKIVTAIWCLSILSVLPFPFTVSLLTHMKIILYSSYFAQAVFLVISLTAYSLVSRSQIRRGFLFGDMKRRASEVSRSYHTFKTSFVLNTSFVVFYVIPNYVPVPHDHQSYLLLTGISYVGLMVDPIIYTLMHKELRPIAIHLFTLNGRLKCWNNDDENAVTPPPKISFVVTPVMGYVPEDPHSHMGSAHSTLNLLERFSTDVPSWMRDAMLIQNNSIDVNKLFPPPLASVEIESLRRGEETESAEETEDYAESLL